MPHKPSAPCRIPGCPQLIPVAGQCPVHPREAWAGSNRRKRLPSNWHAIRQRVLRRDWQICYLCGSPANEVDHINPGDDHSMENLAAICTNCHRKKSSREGNAARHRKKL